MQDSRDTKSSQSEERIQCDACKGTGWVKRTLKFVVIAMEQNACIAIQAVIKPCPTIHAILVTGKAK